jgi:hypothetical protein
MSEEEKEEAGANLDEEIAEYISGMSETDKEVQLRIMLLLRQSHAFCKFVDDHYDIHMAVNHDTKSVDLAVIEKPTVKEVEFKPEGFTLDVAKSLKAQMILKHNDCKNTAQVVKSIINIITGQDGEGKPELITSASDADIDKELQAQKTASKIILD